MSYIIKVNFGHPANTGILRYLEGMQEEAKSLKLFPSISPDDIEDLYTSLSTHPEVVSRLWNEITKDLPERCAWVVYGRPVLVQPESGVIFGMGSGTPTYALRLPEPARSEAVSEGAKTIWTYNNAWHKELGPGHNTVLDLASWGQDWVFGNWLSNESKWCLAAYHSAALDFPQ
jgi:hypothetical protein